MAIKERTGKGDYYYHVYDYPGSEAFKNKKTYNNAQVAAWLNSVAPAAVPIPASRAAEVQPYSQQADAGTWTKEKYRVCRTLGSYNSKATGYGRYSLLKDIQQLRTEAHANLNASLWTANHATFFNRRVYVLKFGSNNPGTPQVLLTGGIHGREWVAVEVPYLIAEYLIKNYSQDATIRNMLDACQIWVIPMLNPDGHCWSAVRERLWRRNRKRFSCQDLITADGTVYADAGNGDLRITPPPPPEVIPAGTFIGVDCNRNFQWGADRERDPRKETFSGPGPNGLTEQETQALSDCVTGALTYEPPPVLPGPAPVAGPPPAPALSNLAASIDYHSARGAIMYHDGAAGLDATSRAVRKVGVCMADHIKDYGDGPEYQLGTTRQIVQQESDGSVMHHCYNLMLNNRIPLAFTIELDPVKAPADVNFGQDRNRWSLKREHLQRVFEKNLTAVLCLIEHATFRIPNPPLPHAGQRHAGQIIGQRGCTFKNWPAKRIKGQGNRPPK